MNATEAETDSGNRAMDIVSMAFSNVSESSDLMEVVSAVSQRQSEDGQEDGADAGTVVVGHCVAEPEGQQSADGSTQNGEDHPDQIEIPLPPNAIITVNEQGEQIIELAQVVGEEEANRHQACLIESVNCVEQVQVEAETIETDEAPVEPAAEVAMTVVGGDGLEEMEFHGGAVSMVGTEACTPVSISLSDVQHLQQAVSDVPVIGPSGDSLQAASAGEVTPNSAPQLPASESSLLRSLALNMMETSSVLTTSSAPLAAAGIDAVTGNGFVSAAGVPVPAVAHVRSTSEPQPTVAPATSVSAPQFIHNGTSLQQISFSENLLLPPKGQLISTTQTSVIAAGSVLHSATAAPGAAPTSKAETAAVMGNRSVFSPMTLTIRTPPGAPAVNQALINSIVNNTEVQALLKRNPGQPITIVRVPEDPLERSNNVGVVTAKVVTSQVGSSLHTPSRPTAGRPRKDLATATVGAHHSKPFQGRGRRGRQPGTKLRRKVEEYTPPVSWQPVKSRTRSGRISRPPGYRTENFRTLGYVDKADNPPSDAEGLSDVEAELGGRVPVTLSGRVKRFKCRSCSKAYIGRGGLARHFGAEPSHGNINDYEAIERTSPKPASEERHPTTERSPESEASNGDVAEGREVPSKMPVEPEEDQPAAAVLEEATKEVEKEGNEDEVADEGTLGADEGTLGDATQESPVMPRKGRTSGSRQSPTAKDDPDFKPGAPLNKSNAKSKERRKETMKQALKFLNNENYMDVCLPRVVRNLSLWDFLLSKAEMDKEDTSQVLKVLQLFEELLSDVREMAVNCLEKVDDEDMQTEGIYLDDDDDLARVLEFDKGWYNVSEPPAGAVSLPLSLLKRNSDAVSQDDLADEEAVAKRRKLDEDQSSKKTPPNLANARPKATAKSGAVADPKAITVHVQDGSVTTEQGSPLVTPLRAPLQEASSQRLPKGNSEQVVRSEAKNEEGVDSGEVNQKASLVEDPKTPTDSGSLSASDVPAAALQDQQPAVHRPEESGPAGETASGNEPAAADENQMGEASSLQPPQLQTEAAASDKEQPVPGLSREDVAEEAKDPSWSAEAAPVPSQSVAQFAQAAEDLASLAASAEAGQSDKVEQVDAVAQDETSVVVPEGSTIMQMQDGTFLVQRPDGTAMQIHTPEGMTIETVQELLSMEAGQ